MERLAELLRDSECTIEDGYLEIYSAEEKLSQIYQQLQKFSYKDEEEIHTENGHPHLSIDLSAQAWPGSSIFYRNIQDIWQRATLKGALPENFYVLDKKAYSAQTPPDEDIKYIQHYLQWLTLLTALNDHTGSKDNDSTLIYFINTEKGAKIHEINPKKISLEKIKEILPKDSFGDELKQLHEIINIEDGHKKERRDVLRNSLSEILDENHPEPEITWLIRNEKRLKKKYHENYDVYLHKFSVNKLLSEIEEKSTDYISKINESISSSQTKAFAIPGAIIAIAALIKSADFFSLLFVCIGLLFVCLITITANNIHNEAYQTLEDQIKRSLNRYETIKNEDEVRISAEKSKEKLLDLIEKSKDRLKFINKLAITMLVIGATYTALTNTNYIAIRATQTFEKINSTAEAAQSIYRSITAPKEDLKQQSPALAPSR